MGGSRWWKLAGLAGLVGVAATGVVIARDQRQRRSYSPEEVRDRLRERYSASMQGGEPTSRAPVGRSDSGGA